MQKQSAESRGCQRQAARARPLRTDAPTSSPDDQDHAPLGTSADLGPGEEDRRAEMASGCNLAMTDARSPRPIQPGRRAPKRKGASSPDALRCQGGCKKGFLTARGRDHHWTTYPSCEERHVAFVRGTPEELEHRASLERRARQVDRPKRKYRPYSRF